MDEVSQTPGDFIVLICDQCGTSFPNKYQLTIHQRIHQGKKICECQYCYKYFLNKSHLIVHERSHTGERPYRCDQCGKYFKTGSYLNLHKRIRCLKKLIRSHTGQKTYKCDQCGAKLTSSHKLRIHLQIHKGKEIHECRYCGKFCLFISELEKHERFHTREQPYGCDQCGMKFSLNSQLDQHKHMYCLKKKEKYRRKPNISCSTLILKEETFKSDDSGTKVEKLYKCEKCGNVFTRLWDLQKHWKLHAGEGKNEPLTFTCDKCGKVYTKLWGLEKHRKLHNAERPNVSNTNLIEVKEETPYSNEGEDEKLRAKTTCEKDEVFTRGCDLQRHLELHTKERPNVSSPNHIIPKEEPDDRDLGKQTDRKLYPCDQCGKVFTGQGDLQRHWELHNTDRPNISTPNLVLKKETYHSYKDKKVIVKEKKEKLFLCKDCGIVVKVQCTNLENVLSLTNPSNVKCFIEEHTLLSQ